jgi:redox-sensitive bicupin YhaK (pirin superfamily)
LPLPGGGGTVRVIAGEFGGKKGPARTFTPMNVWDVRLEPGTIADLSQEEGWTVQVVVLAGTIQVNGGRSCARRRWRRFPPKAAVSPIEANNEAKILLLAGSRSTSRSSATGPS